MTSFVAECRAETAPQKLAERALELSRADSCVVIAEESGNVNLRWANNTLTSNGRTRSRALTVIATVDGAEGSAAGVVSQSGVTDASLETLTRAAEATARATPPAEDAEPLIVAERPSRNWDDPPAETTFRVFDSLVPALAEVISSARRQRRVLFGYAAQKLRSTFLASSTGLRLRSDHRSGYVQLNMRSPDHADSVWTGASTHDFCGAGVEALYGELAERFAWGRARHLTLPAGRYETLLSPSAVADLMVCLYDSAGARDAHDGRGAFGKPGRGTRVGERISEAAITLRSDPAAPGLECAPFVLATSSDSASSVFDNGLELQPTNWITDGTLSALVQTRHSARLTGLPVTPRINNLILEGPPGGPTLHEMIRNTARGLLVTCLWYVREVEPRTLLHTGLTRDGVFLVADGEVVGAVNNFRFNESPVELLARVTEVGVTELALARERGGYFPHTAMPWLRVEQFNMSSVSEVS